MGFYILWSHTAAFSKQLTIIRSDKRANAVHSHRSRKNTPPRTTRTHRPLCQAPSSCILAALFSPSFSHFTLYVLVISLPLFFSAPSPAGLERGGRLNTYNNTSISASLQSGIVRHDVFHDKHNRSSAVYPVTSYENGVVVQRSQRCLRNFGFVKVRAFILYVIEW